MIRNNKYYPTVDEFLSYNQTSAQELFSVAEPLFNGTLTYTDPETGETKNYPNIGYNATALYEYWDTYYNDRRMGFPLKNISMWSTLSEINAAQQVLVIRVKKIIKNYCDSNKYRFLTLIKTLNYNYDPIHNYQYEEDKESYLGKVTDKFVADTDREVITVPHVSVNTANGAVSSYTNADGNKTTASAAAGSNAPTTTHKVVPYDGGQYEQTIDIQSGQATTEVKETPNSVITKDGNYTRTKEQPVADKSVENITKKGIINGDIQDLIEKEREVARFNIIKEFFDGLNHEILLDTYY